MFISTNRVLFVRAFRGTLLAGLACWATSVSADPYFFDEHVTVTVKNGVALLEGVVFDEWDERQAIRIAKKIAGVKRVVTDFDIPDGQ